MQPAGRTQTSPKTIWWHSQCLSPQCCRICESLDEESQWPHREQEVDASQVIRGARKCWCDPISMVDEMQTQSHHQWRHQTQVKAQFTQWKASLWDELLWHICPCCNLVCYQACQQHFHSLSVILTSDWFHPGLPSDFYWDGYVYGAPKKAVKCIMAQETMYSCSSPIYKGNSKLDKYETHF